MAQEELEIDNMSDDEFEAMLDEQVTEDQFAADEDDIADEIDDETAGDEGEDTEDDEDTDHEDDLDDSEDDDDAQTNDGIDGEDQDSDEDEDELDEEDDEENTQVDDDSLSADDTDDKSKDDESDDKDSEDAKDDTDTKTEDDDKKSDTDDIDYKKEYERFKGFYDEVTSEFKANGRTVRGFDDPKKIIEAQQMAANFSEKMAGFKQYRPYMAPLKERGILEDQTKFDLAMNLLDGDKEALKQHIKNLDIDPLDLDMDEIKYEGKRQTSSDFNIALEDLYENAERNGVKQQVNTVIGQQWDNESLVELVQDQKSAADLVDHLSSGAFDAVQDRIAEIKRADFDGRFNSLSDINQYRTAAQQLETEYQEYAKTQGTTEAPTAQADLVAEEKAKIEKERQEAEYKAQVEQKNKQASEARKKAASVSKKKVKRKPKKKTFDPMALDDDAFAAELDKMMY
jgi:hypothetical protein